MEILGIGPLEIIMILLIAFIVLGPGDMAKTGRIIGRFLRNIVSSQWWIGLRKASLELRKLPFTLMREANLDEFSQEINDLKSIGGSINTGRNPVEPFNYSSWTNPNPGANAPISNASIKKVDPKPDEVTTKQRGS